MLFNTAIVWRYPKQQTRRLESRDLRQDRLNRHQNYWHLSERNIIRNHFPDPLAGLEIFLWLFERIPPENIYLYFFWGGGFCLIKQKCNLWGANTFETSISQMTFSPRLIKRTIYSWERIYCDQMLFVGCQYFWNQYFTNEFFNIDLKKWPLAYV